MTDAEIDVAAAARSIIGANVQNLARRPLLATSLFGDLAAGLHEDASARLREHPALLRLFNLAPDPRAVGHLDLPAGDKELPETANPITECDRVRSYAALDPPIWVASTPFMVSY